jgi:hypothetical protein
MLILDGVYPLARPGPFGRASRSPRTPVPLHQVRPPLPCRWQRSERPIGFTIGRRPPEGGKRGCYSYAPRSGRTRLTALAHSLRAWRWI